MRTVPSGVPSWRKFGVLASMAMLSVSALSGTANAAETAPAQPTTHTEESRTEEPSDEPKEFRFEFGLFGGYHFFPKESGLGRSDADPPEISPANAPTFGGRLALNFNPYVGVEVEAGAIPTHTVNNLTDMWVFGYRGSLILHFVANAPVRPFLSLGYGALSSIVNDTTVVKSDTDGMVHAGLGFKIAFGEYAGLRLEGRVLAPPAFASSVVKVGDELGYHGPDYEVLGGLYVNFSQVEKVRETVVKREVVMVQPPPPPDPDGDGIVGDKDKCPDVAEDKDGFEDEDGCPDPDNDLDGIPDPQDKCPMKAETKNGIDDDDGCPEEDTDGDGILGSRDKCPDEPETKNNYKDDDGCPDEVPVEVKKFTGVIEGINFKTGSANILPGSYAILDRAVSVLKEYSDVRLEISGHTDSRGKADYNRDLSQRRADAVKMYFVANGVAADRLTSIGYGFDRPIADNKTEAGRAKNRRTEFRLLGLDEGTPPPPPPAP